VAKPCEDRERRCPSTSEKNKTKENTHVDNWILDFYPLKLGENKFLLFKPTPTCGILL
jgi:hypothetical protein